MRKFKLYQLWFLVPGVALVATSVLVPLNYLYAQLYWTPTEAIITGTVLNNDGPEAERLTLMDFTDHEGVIHHISEEDDDEESDSPATGAEDQHIRIYYNPLNPTDYVLANDGRYLIVLFLPLGLLACYLGWPDEDE
ncbi:hypothetical protein [uncultured Imperialibacter sp.]|uniref:hypothetical protein n=1 Tax=uncultured Imperialibacter sp. TaxID=1672639 RepID=UPI0030DAF4C8